jgi:membrane-bound inhibitor of C-type lysozyme
MSTHTLPRRRLPGLLAVAASVSGLLTACTTPVVPPATAAQDAPEIRDVRYRCDGGVELAVSYLNAPSGESFATLSYQGRNAVLENRPTASGVRYVDQDEQQGLRWYTKGDSGFLAHLAPDHTAKEETVINNCQAQPAP